ncbi:hypothetical protein [Cohnella caldifontis]|uniref:hypothetical protein n=1 Tax=Cohnella caldifontis TaxID=3027471 RepID=UPI003BB7F1D8
MIVNPSEYFINGLKYYVRSAVSADAAALSALRLQIDGETENMDREPGEAFLDAEAFRRIIQTDTEKQRNIFLVAETDGRQ